MSTTSAAPPQHHGRHAPGPAQPPDVPLTLDGSAVLHQMFRLRRAEWNKLSSERRKALSEEAVAALQDHHPERDLEHHRHLRRAGEPPQGSMAEPLVTMGSPNLFPSSYSRIAFR